jgi:hypothetical protein
MCQGEEAIAPPPRKSSKTKEKQSSNAVSLPNSAGAAAWIFF